MRADVICAKLVSICLNIIVAESMCVDVIDEE